mmetsp:Transcript_19375/g.41783  ORF Transcript_19375/g.41783 Transcript_19375/m.41783 type:complete len:265 (-) Transcript_19375:87-881(-)
MAKRAADNSVMLLYGWLGSTPKQVAKYSKLLERPGRSVQTCILPSTAYFSGDKVLKQYAEGLASDALKAAKTADRVGFFSMSGNGSTAAGLTLIGLRARAEQGDDSAKALLDGQLGCMVYDSSPVQLQPSVLTTGFVSMLALKLGLDPGTVLSTPGVQPASKLAFGAFTSLPSRQRWSQNLYDVLLTPQVSHLLLYSEADPVVPFEMVEDFGKALSNSSMGRVHLEKFEGSDHVAHYRKHPELYRRVVNEFLEEELEKFQQANE